MVRTELYINGANGTDGYLSFPFGVNIPVSINFNLADVRNPEQRKASRSQTINLFGTNEVNKLFENLFEVNVVTQYFNKNLKTPVRYLVDGLENFAGDMQLIRINIKPDNSIVYECSIIGEGGSLFFDIGEKLIVGNTDSNEDLDFSDYDHNYTRANQIASRTNVGTGLGYSYPFVDRGTNGGSDTVFNVKDFLPCFSVYEYVKKIIENTGRTFTSTFLESSFFKHLYCYPNLITMNGSLAQQQASQLYAGLNSNIALITSPSTSNITYNTIQYNKETPSPPFFDLGNQNLNGIITIAFSKNYNIVAHQKVKLRFSYVNPPDIADYVLVTGGIYIYNYLQKSTDGGVTWNDILTISNQPLFFGQTWTSNYSINYGELQTNFNINQDYFDTFDIATGDIPLNVGDKIRHRFFIRKAVGFYDPDTGDFIEDYQYIDSAGNYLDNTFGTENYQSVSGIGGSTYYALNSQSTLMEGDLLEVNNALPTKIKQKEFLTSILKAFNLFVEVNPNDANNLLIEPFDEFYNTTDILNYENRTDLGKDQTINPNLLEGKRYIYSYKEDKDYYNDLYKKTYNEVFGTEQIDVDNDFIKSDKKTELIFSATPLIANYGLGIAQPRIYTLDGTNKKTIAANIRLIYCDVKTSPNPYTYKQSGLTDLVTTEYLHGGMEDDAMNPTVSLMFGPAKEFYYSYINAYFTNNTLYNAYHKQYIANLIDRDGKFVTKFLWLNPKDINQFSFRNRLFIDGSYYIVNKIENYTPLDQTSTKVELIKLLETVAFIPEQFLISDSPINAGDGVATARLNSSLNIGTNIQNRGTNCLAVGNNIVIPDSCTNLIVFGSNITADENSTGLILNYKSYVALITQTGTSAPTLNILENTIGDIVWTRFGVGDYRGTLTGAFINNKVICFSNQTDTLTTTTILRKNIDSVFINTGTSGTSTLIDSALVKTSIEIRVYN